MSKGPPELDALDLLPEAVVVLDGDGRITHVNDRARPLLGLDDQSVGKPVADALDLRDETGAAVLAELNTSNRVDRLAERVLRLTLPDGRVRPVSVSGRLVDGGPVTLTFRSAGRRERVDEARSDLVATVSHEIRSPLTSVKGFARTMLLKWERFSDEQKQAMLETINEDADRVTRLLTELLDVSRIDAGRVQLHRQEINVHDVAERVADRARHRVDAVGRTIVVAGEATPPLVLGDPDKLEQVIHNLVENALRYAPESDVRIAVSTDRDSVLLRVTDEGPGIAEDQHRRVFEKFGRGRGQRGSGTGLGLYITRGLVRAHGGEVQLESTEDAGATFTVVLPRSHG